MKNHLIILLLILSNFGCKEPNKDNSKNSAPKEQIALDTLKDNVPSIIIKDTLASVFDFKKVLNTLKDVKHTKDKHKDWMFNKARTLRTSLQLNFTDFKIKSTSYTYKKDCVFYLHTLSHTNDSISIKPFLENAQGKPTEGYTGERVLIFAMKNNKIANFIDIPANWNYIELKEELLDILNKNINSDVIECYRTKECIYKDLRKNKQ